MLLKFLLSPLSILTTIILIAVAVFALIALAKYLQAEDVHNLFNRIEKLQNNNSQLLENISDIEKTYEETKEQIEEKKRLKKEKKKQKKRRA